MPGDPSAPDPLARVILDLPASAPALPASCQELLKAWKADALAVLSAAPGGIAVDAAWASEAVLGWPPGPLRIPGGDSLPVPQGVTDTGAGSGPWPDFLSAGGCRRALVLPLDGHQGLPALVVARASSRPLPAGTARQAARLAACLGLVRRPPTEVSAGEVGALLDLSRRLALASDLPDLMDVVEDALDRILEWSTCALLPGGGHAPALVRGGRLLDAGARGAAEGRLRQLAGAAGVTWCGAQWREPLPVQGTGLPAGAVPPPLVLTLAASGTEPGLLAVWAGAIPGEGERRLVAALAQQTALYLARWQRARERERQRLETILEAIPCGVLLLEAEGQVGACNRAAREMLQSMAGRTPEPGSAAGSLGLPGEGVPSGVGVEFSSRRDQRSYAVRWMPLAGAGSPGGRVVALTDVTVERARQEQEIKVERMLALGEMLSGVAHELNNPLASVVGFSQLLVGQTQDDRTHRRLSIIAEEAQRARRIVHNLLDVARSRAPAREPVDLNDVVSGILALFAYQFRLDGVRVDWAPAAGLPPVVGDRHQLQQVLVNLVANAQHALRGAPGDRTLRVQTDATAGRVRLEVADTGPGIPAAHLDRIFDRFFTTKDQGVGTGLGLSIAARIVEDHGGAIHARSEPSAGAVFTIDLPAGRPSPALSIADAAPARRAPGTRVLVVEDEDSFRLLLEEALLQENYRVVTAPHGAAALEILAGGEFDAVVSDLRMPVMDGVQLFRQIRDQHPDLAGKFVFMTGDLLDQGTRSFLEEAGAPCLPKPFGLEELHRALDRLPARRGAATAVLRSRPEGECP